MKKIIIVYLIVVGVLAVLFLGISIIQRYNSTKSNSVNTLPGQGMQKKLDPKQNEINNQQIMDKNEQVLEVSVKELTANPSKYNGKKIRTVGLYDSGFERSVLYASKEDFDNPIWLAIEPLKMSNQVYLRPGDTKYFEADVEVEGTFYYDQNGYGHLGMYKFEIR